MTFVNHEQNRDQLSIILVICVLVSICCCSYNSFSQNISYEDYKLQASDYGHSEQFGSSVSFYGDTAVIGDWRDDQLGTLAGAAYVYRYSSENGWVEETKLLAPNGQADDLFGIKVAIDKDIVVVGATHHGIRGTVFVFRYIKNSGWVLEAELVASDENVDYIFGSDVAISGSTILVGSSWYYDVLYSGAVYVFKNTNSNQWIEQTKLLPSDPKPHSHFGISISIAGDIAAIGADMEELKGAVYIYRRQPDDTWIEEAKLQPSDGQVNDNFGWPVSLSGERLLAGTPSYALDSPGYAYIWQFSDNNGWEEKAKLLHSDWSIGDDFGGSVSLFGDIALIGASGKDDGNLWNTGAVYIFQYNTKLRAWIERDKLLASDAQEFDSLGIAVSLYKNIAFAGANRHQELGAAYVYHNVAPLSLQIKGSCPGIMRVTVYGGETEIGDRLAVVYGIKKGSSEVMPYCAGLFVDIGQPVRIAGYGKADGMGEFSVTGKVPKRGCGKILVQGINITKCEKTERVLVLE